MVCCVVEELLFSLSVEGGVVVFSGVVRERRNVKESDTAGSGVSVDFLCPVSTGSIRLLGSLRLTVVMSALVSSCKFPRSGVDVQDAAGLPLLNLEVTVSLLLGLELSSTREPEPEEVPLLELRELTPLSVLLELPLLLSSRERDEGELQLDRLGLEAVASSLLSESGSFRGPCSL